MSVEAQTATPAQPLEAEVAVSSKVGERLRSGGAYINEAAQRLADRLDARAQRKAERRYAQKGLTDLEGVLDGTSAEASNTDDERETRVDKARKLFRSIGSSATSVLRATGELAVGAGIVAGGAAKSGVEKGVQAIADKAGDVRDFAETKASEVRSALIDRMDEAFARKQARLEARAQRFAQKNADRLERRQAVQSQSEAYATYGDNISATAEREAAESFAEQQESNRLEKEQRELRLAQEKAEREARIAERAAEAEARKQARRKKWAARKQALSLAIDTAKEAAGDKVSEASDAFDRFADKVDDKIDATVESAAKKAAAARSAVVEGASRIAETGRRGYESTTEALKNGTDRVRRGGEWLKTRTDNVRAIGSAAISAAIEAGRSTSAAIKVNEQLGQ